ncbi:MAG: very short patch repair endonuclease [Acidobacteriota bacterium]|nr:very short patch repair endonuclease [Acidobacteriota bacterium]
MSRKKTRPGPSSPAARKRMQATRRRDTPGELALRAGLTRLGVRYRVDAVLPGTRRRADVAFLGARVAVFVDGCFWHGCPMHGTWPKANSNWWRSKIEDNMKRDRDTDRRLLEMGWVVFRVWEHQDSVAAAQKIADAVRQRRASRSNRQSA